MVIRFGIHHLLITMQEISRVGDVMHVCSDDQHRMDQILVLVQAFVNLHHVGQSSVKR